LKTGLAETIPRLHRVAASVWREAHRELRRHASDERLPYRLRTTLRGAAADALRRCAVAEGRAVVPRWNRQAIRAAAPVRLPPEDVRRARELAGELGIVADQPIVTIELRSRPDLFSDGIDVLVSEGYQVVRIGDPVAGPLRRRGVVDVAPFARTPALLETYLVQASAFVICGSSESQAAAYRVHTPSLRVDARDPLIAYPIRHDSLYTLATVVDLDTGRALPIPELLTEDYFRNTRNCGYRATSAGEITAAVREMIHGVRHAWSETDAQVRFRRAVAEAGVALGPRIRDVLEWDAASGFIGDGRLAASQAERAA
jgi:putative glycosyltransferase (TIGR04372 family)